MRAVLDLLAQLYDAVLEPSRFPAVVNETIRHLEIQGMFFAGISPSSGVVFHYLEGVPPPVSGILLERFMHPDRNPFARVLLARPPMELVTTEMAGDVTQTDFYRELMVPSGLHEFLGTVLLADADLISPLNAFRTSHQPRFGPADQERLRQLLPHYQRAAQLLLRFRALQSEQRAGQDVLDRLPYGVFLLDGAGALTVCNRAGEAILRLGDGLALHDGRLAAAHPDDAARLDRMIADAALTGSHQGLGSGGALTVARRSERSRYEVLVAPCGAAPPLPSTSRATAVVVFVTDRDQAPDLSPDLLHRLYGLTPAESQVAAAIAGGLRPAAVAQHLGVSLNTVRTHLYRVFEKTETRRQAELVKLLTGGPLGLGTPPFGLGKR